MKLVHSGHTVLHLRHEFFCYNPVFTQPIELQKTLSDTCWNREVYGLLASYFFEKVGVYQGFL